MNKKSKLNHHVNNALTIIIGKSAILKIKSNDPEVIAAMEIINKEAKRAAKALKDYNEYTPKKIDPKDWDIFLS